MDKEKKVKVPLYNKKNDSNMNNKHHKEDDAILNNDIYDDSNAELVNNDDVFNEDAIVLNQSDDVMYNSNNLKNKKVKNKGKSFFKFQLKKFNFWYGVFGGAVLSLIIIIYLFARYSIDLPDYDKLAEYKPSIITRFYAGDGTLLTEYAEENRVFVEYDQLPPNLINAFLSAEDKKFWKHSGIDVWGIMRAILSNIKAMFTGGNFQGASTITQQVAKNFFLSSERSLERKIKEAILALKIERAFTKKHILVLYFNQIYLGARSYGVAAAAQSYFNKTLNELSLSECAFLAALPKAPNNYNPVTKKERAIERRNWVLQRMLANGYITEDEYENAKNDDLVVSKNLVETKENANLYFTEEVRRLLSKTYGTEQLYRGGLVVRTTANSEYQKIATEALRNMILAYDKRTGWKGPETSYNLSDYSWIDEKISELKKNREKLKAETDALEDSDGDESSEVKVKTDGPLERLNDLKKKLAANAGLEKSKRVPDWFIILNYDPVISGMEKQGWRKAIVLSVDDQNAKIGMKDKVIANVNLSTAMWARPTHMETMTVGPVPTSMRQIVKPGDVIFVEPTDKKGEFALKQNPKLEGALVAMDPHTGRVLTLVGGFSFAKSKFNRATQAKRQPGSAIKPLMYLTALVRPNYEPNSILLDAPIVMEKEDGNLWKPDNADNQFWGPMTLRQALMRSKNSPAIRLANAVGIHNAVRMAEKFGVYKDIKNEDINLSMALGSGDTTVLDLTTAFASILNGGKKITPRLVDRIQDRDGRTIYNFEQRQCEGCQTEWQDGLLPPIIEDQREQLADPRGVYQLISIMEGVVSAGGTGTMARIPGRTIAGKTGTTNDNKDGWFVGGTTDLVVGVWVGFDQPRNMGEYNNGATLSAPIFEAFVRRALAGTKDKAFPVPDGIKFVRINDKTGNVATANDDPKDVVLMPLKNPDAMRQNNNSESNNMNNPESNRPYIAPGNYQNDPEGIF